jgi:hypothetical protein
MAMTIGSGITLGGGITISPVYAANDPYFNQVSLLLHGDGTAGAQNNTFLDSSTNNFAITRNGNTTQGTFTPFSQTAGYWSNYFNGSTDYLTEPASTNYAFGTGDFTIECWFYSGNMANNGLLQISTVVGGFNPTSGAGLALSTYNSQVGMYANGTNYNSQGPTISNNTWNHVALVRSSGVTNLYINGSLVTGYGIAGAITDTTNYTGTNLVIGGYYSTSYLWNGYISNIRVVKGTAVYTTTFTPSTTPLTAVTNTQLLTCQSNYFKDNSSNNFTLTATGTPSVQPFSPFAPTAAYSTGVNGGSMYFDGSGDYLSVPSNAALGMGTLDFTMEGWLYLPAYPTAGNFMDPLSNASADPQVSPSFYINSTGLLRYYVNGTNAITSSASVPLNSWVHFALSRSSTSTKLFINGTQTGSTYTDTNNYVTCPVTIGAYFNGTETLSGYISNIRIVKGTAVYTADFTPPTAPLTAITNTSLLLNGTNAGILDNAIKNTLETVGSAQVSTSVVKYGTGSMSFNGTTDYLKIPSSVNLAFGSGDFTIEFWAYLNSISGQPFFFDQRTADNQFTPCLYSSGVSNGIFSYFLNGADRITASTALTTGQWYHIALCRSSGNTKLFYNGTQTGSTYVDSGTYISGQLVIGVRYVFTYNLNAYIDDFRITKGVARYTANFTPPTQAFPNQ